MENKTKIIAYSLGGLSCLLIANQIMKYNNDGIGFLTTKRTKLMYILTNEETQKDYSTPDWVYALYVWYSDPKYATMDFINNWYKAVWRTMHGNPQETFFANGGKEYYTTKGDEVL